MRSRNYLSRREFLQRTTLGVVGASWGPFFLFPHRAEASRKMLRVLHWKHFAPAYDHWFDQVFTKEWGQKHDTKVIVDHVPLERIRRQAELEIATRKGHDLVIFGSLP